MAMGVTRKDVARLAGVSTTTVSYVVNHGPRPVTKKTEHKVLLAIDQLGYRPSAIARSLVTKRTDTIGFVLPDIMNPIHAAIAKAFEDALRSAGFSLIIGNSDETYEIEREYLNNFLCRELDGIALTPTGKNINLLLPLVESGQHLVLLDRLIEGLYVDCVLFDNLTGAYQAVWHLIELGHTRIGLINLSRSTTPGQERLDGYLKALIDAGIPVEPLLIVEGGFKAQEGEVLVERLLALDLPPTAIFVGSNRLMDGVLRVIKQRGIRVPEELALVTFDDLGFYSNQRPSITAVASSSAEFGSEAARLLIERVRKTYSGEPRVLRIPCELKVRESTVGFS
jgi:LacI family transcriptional regulator